MVMIFIFDGVTVKTSSLSQLRSEILERGVDRIVTLLALVIYCHSWQYKETFGLSAESKKELWLIRWHINKVARSAFWDSWTWWVLHNVADMRRPFRSRCCGVYHFCIQASSLIAQFSSFNDCQNEKIVPDWNVARFWSGNNFQCNLISCSFSQHHCAKKKVTIITIDVTFRDINNLAKI